MSFQNKSPAESDGRHLGRRRPGQPHTHLTGKNQSDVGLARQVLVVDVGGGEDLEMLNSPRVGGGDGGGRSGAAEANSSRHRQPSLSSPRGVGVWGGSAAAV